MTPAPAALRFLPATCLLAVALVLGASGCGEEGSGAAEGGGKSTPTTTAQTGGGATPTPTAGCPRQLDAFIDSLTALRRRLAIGLSYEQYVAQVKALRGSYAEIPVDRLTLDCLAIGIPSEQALNKHIDAANSWGECLADATCTTQTIEPVLQRKWRIASRHLSEAR